VLATETQAELPPIMVGRATPAVAAQVQDFYESVAAIFERWVTVRCRHLRALGHPPRLDAHPARLPPGRHGLRCWGATERKTRLSFHRRKIAMLYGLSAADSQ
jgi:hypothetical protein